MRSVDVSRLNKTTNSAAISSRRLITFLASDPSGLKPTSRSTARTRQNRSRPVRPKSLKGAAPRCKGNARGNLTGADPQMTSRIRANGIIPRHASDKAWLYWPHRKVSLNRIAIVPVIAGLRSRLCCLAAHGCGFGGDPGNVGVVDTDIRPFPVRHCRKLAPSPVVDVSCPAPLCMSDPELLDRIMESLEGMDGKYVLKCHVFGLSFQMADFDPPQIANGCVWLILGLHRDRHWTISVNQA